MRAMLSGLIPAVSGTSGAGWSVGGACTTTGRGKGIGAGHTSNNNTKHHNDGKYVASPRGAHRAVVVARGRSIAGVSSPSSLCDSSASTTASSSEAATLTWSAARGGLIGGVGVGSSFATRRTRLHHISKMRRGVPRGGGGGIQASASSGGSEALKPGGWRQYASVACVMLAVFLHLLGFTVTGPITPGLVTHFGLHPSEVGYLTSAYPLGMFFALFAWPRLSDKVGRKPILVLSLLGVGCGLIAQAACVARDWSLAGTSRTISHFSKNNFRSNECTFPFVFSLLFFFFSTVAFTHHSATLDPSLAGA